VSDFHYFSRQTPLLSTQELAKTKSFSHSIGEKTLQFLTSNAVFSKAGFDSGSDLLLRMFFDHSSARNFPRIGDLGCGYGAIGVFCAARYPKAQVFSIDVNARAVQLCAASYAKNELRNGFAWCGDGFDAVGDSIFDAILFNPPVRAGNAVIAKLFDDCQRTLSPSGELWVVLRTAQGAKTWAKRLQNQFGSCETIEISSGYRILLVKKI
jgi:16S rRNA (guanine1207-N2)-methyltransferase